MSNWLCQSQGDKNGPGNNRNSNENEENGGGGTNKKRKKERKNHPHESIGHPVAWSAVPPEVGPVGDEDDGLLAVGPGPRGLRRGLPGVPYRTWGFHTHSPVAGSMFGHPPARPPTHPPTHDPPPTHTPGRGRGYPPPPTHLCCRNRLFGIHNYKYLYLKRSPSGIRGFKPFAPPLLRRLRKRGGGSADTPSPPTLFSVVTEEIQKDICGTRNTNNNTQIIMHPVAGEAVLH